MTTVPTIFNIQPFSLEDGPGIRTTIFFKGCPLSCSWCHNPESHDPNPTLSWKASACLACGDCLKICSHRALSRIGQHVHIHKERCILCGQCLQRCPTNALHMVGTCYPIAELRNIVLRDQAFYDCSDGGVTFSGGEPTVHLDYLSRLAKELKSQNIHLTLQTAGLFDLHDFQTKLLPYLDLIHFDLKLMDPHAHLRYTGMDNALILENFEILSRICPSKLQPRIPLIPGITDTPENLTATQNFLTRCGMHNITTLRYNPTGSADRDLQLQSAIGA